MGGPYIIASTPRCSSYCVSVEQRKREHRHSIAAPHRAERLTATAPPLLQLSLLPLHYCRGCEDRMSATDTAASAADLKVNGHDFFRETAIYDCCTAEYEVRACRISLHQELGYCIERRPSCPPVLLRTPTYEMSLMLGAVSRSQFVHPAPQRSINQARCCCSLC